MSNPQSPSFQEDSDLTVKPKRKKQSEDSPIECEICNQQFAPNAIVKHELVHSLARQYNSEELLAFILIKESDMIKRLDEIKDIIQSTYNLGLAKWELAQSVGVEEDISLSNLIPQ